jgi:hypothetical protein
MMVTIYKYMISIGTVLFLFGACTPANESPAASSDGAIRGLLIARAQAVSAATSALESIDRGEIDVARSTLEAQVTSGLTVLYSLREDVKTQAKADEVQLIDGAIQEAEDYASRKKLKVVRPNQ